eukprot:COSAG02_NODE_210_length_28878_cov_133.787136_10_plen_126_part_00
MYTIVCSVFCILYSVFCILVAIVLCAELRPVERARGHLLKKMLKKPRREDGGADALWGSPCSAQVWLAPRASSSQAGRLGPPWTYALKTLQCLVAASVCPGWTLFLRRVPVRVRLVALDRLGHTH